MFYCHLVILSSCPYSRLFQASSRRPWSCARRASPSGKCAPKPMPAWKKILERHSKRTRRFKKVISNLYPNLSDDIDLDLFYIYFTPDRAGLALNVPSVRPTLVQGDRPSDQASKLSSYFYFSPPLAGGCASHISFRLRRKEQVSALFALTLLM